MKTLIFALAIVSFPAFASSDCKGTSSAHLQQLRSSGDGELRAEAGKCLVRHHLSRGEAAQQVLKIIKDQKEDLLLREDLIQALAEAPLRKKIRVEEELVPTLDKEQQEAVNRTLSGAEGLLAVTQAVKGMDEIVPVTHLEREFFRALSDIALEDSNPILLRGAAVNTLEALAKRVVASGVYDDRSIRMAHETLNTVALRDDNGSYFSGAATAYVRLAEARIPHFVRQPDTTRVLASEKNQ